MKKYSAYGYLLDTRFNVVGEPTAINADGIAFWLYVGLKWEFMIALFYLPDTCYTDRPLPNVTVYPSKRNPLDSKCNSKYPNQPIKLKA